MTVAWLLQVCSRAEGERSYETMRAMLEQRRRSFEHLPEDERPDDEMIMKRWHKDLQSSSEARERAVGADSTQLLVRLLTETSPGLGSQG